MQLNLFNAKHEAQCVFDSLERGEICLDGGSTAEFPEGFDIQHGDVTPTIPSLVYPWRVSITMNMLLATAVVFAVGLDAPKGMQPRVLMGERLLKREQVEL
jgi:hypothetical protein